MDTSDREVNIKILLDTVVAAELTGERRDKLLASMTDEVAALVLRDNYEQNVALDVALARRGRCGCTRLDLAAMEAAGKLDRAVEDLPDDQALREPREGLTAPELAVRCVREERARAHLLERSDETELESALDYFRPIERFVDQVPQHPLRREIVASQVANRVVNDAGVTFGHRLSMETAASAEELARA